MESSSKKSIKEIKREKMLRKLHSEKGQTKQDLNLAKDKVKSKQISLGLVKPFCTKISFFENETELHDYVVMDREEKRNASPIPYEEIRSKKKKLKDAEIEENRLKLNLSQIEDKKESLKDDKKNKNKNKNKKNNKMTPAATTSTAASVQDEPHKPSRIYVIYDEEE